MTNIIATVIISITTNWTTVSTTYPAPCDIPGCLVLHLPTENQVGVVTSNTVARFKLCGREVEQILEAVEIGRTSRSINADPSKAWGFAK